MPRSTFQHAIRQHVSPAGRKRGGHRVPASGEAAEPVQGQATTITPDALAEFQQLYQREYGIQLSPEEAHVKAQELIELFRVLLRPPR